ncbi:hypothetical protein [Streptomyces adustus]|uniref:hypothetical protein n=1 Tax=Streptomyces adustus TaxID=1609272 RepID=UPI003711E7EE
MAQAAGTDAWSAVRERMEGVFARRRGGPGDIGPMLLERMSAELSLLQEADAQRARDQWAQAWRRYLQAWLESLDESERAAAISELRQVTPGTQPVVGRGEISVQARRDVVVRAENASVAGTALQVEGGIHLSGPFPGPPGAGR